MLRLANFFMRLEARLSYALIGLVQATGYAGGLDYAQNIEIYFSEIHKIYALQNRNKFDKMKSS